MEEYDNEQPQTSRGKIYVTPFRAIYESRIRTERKLIRDKMDFFEACTKHKAALRDKSVKKTKKYNTLVDLEEIPPNLRSLFNFQVPESTNPPPSNRKRRDDSEEPEKEVNVNDYAQSKSETSLHSSKLSSSLIKENIELQDQNSMVEKYDLDKPGASREQIQLSEDKCSITKNIFESKNTDLTENFEISSNPTFKTKHSLMKPHLKRSWSLPNCYRKTDVQPCIRSDDDVDDAVDNGPEVDTGDNCPEDHAGDNCPEDDIGNNDPEDDAGNNDPENDAGNNDPEKYAGDNCPEDDAGDNCPEDDVGDENQKDDAGEHSHKDVAGDDGHADNAGDNRLDDTKKVVYPISLHDNAQVVTEILEVKTNSIQVLPDYFNIFAKLLRIICGFLFLLLVYVVFSKFVFKPKEDPEWFVKSFIKKIGRKFINTLISDFKF